MLRNEREVFRYVIALVPSLADAEDIVQETALSLWEKFDEYDRNQPFAPWACRFALNKVREHRRRSAKHATILSDEVLAKLLEERAQYEHDLDRRRDALVDCLNRLPDADRRLIDRRYRDNRSVADLAQADCGRGRDAIYKALQRIRRTIMECIRRTLQGGAA